MSYEQGAQQLRELATELQCWHAEHMADFTAADSYNTCQDQRQQTVRLEKFLIRASKHV